MADQAHYWDRDRRGARDGMVQDAEAMHGRPMGERIDQETPIARRATIRQAMAPPSVAARTGLSGAELAEYGQIKAINNADPLWCGFALRAIRWCADHSPTVTADDVWARLAAEDALTTANPSALGTLIKRDAYKRLGWLAPVQGPGAYVASKRPERHLSPVRVWRSLRFKPRQTALPLGDLASDAGLA